VSMASRPLSSSPVVNGGECCVRFHNDSLHELVGPANQLGTLAELIRRKHGGVLDEESETLLALMQRSATRLQELIGGLRTYLNITAPARSGSHCDANQLLAAALVSIQPEIDYNDAIVSHDRLPELDCDPSQIVFVFAELIQNSVRFRTAQRPQIHISANAQDDMWVFSVRDNGIGIDPRHADRVFGLFKRIDNNASSGAGVGLAIARHVVEQHGGRIWVDSRPGLGATFYFSLGRGYAGRPMPQNAKE